MAAGALSLKFAPAGLSEISLWKIKIHTSTLGTATFSPTFSPHPDVATYFIDLGNTPLTADQIQFIGDSVAIVVPEPSSFVLAALGLIGLVIWRRRKL